MHCPNCAHMLQPFTVNSIQVHHCNYCGGTLLNGTDINRLDLDSALHLSSQKQVEFTNTGEKHDPIDGTLMQPISNDPAIPPHITVYQNAQKTHMFVPAEDMAHLKQHQHIRQETSQPGWRKSLDNLRPVFYFAVMTLVALTATGVFIGFPLTNSPSTEADIGVHNIHIEKPDAFRDEVYMYFTTQENYASSILLHNKETKEVQEIPIAVAPTTIHIITSEQLPTNGKYEYVLILRDEAGNEIRTSQKPFLVK